MLPKVIYIVHDGSGLSGEPYEDRKAAFEMADDLSEQEGTPWYVGRYQLEEAKLKPASKIDATWITEVAEKVGELPTGLLATRKLPPSYRMRWMIVPKKDSLLPHETARLTPDWVDTLARIPGLVVERKGTKRVHVELTQAALEEARRLFGEKCHFNPISHREET